MNISFKLPSNKSIFGSPLKDLTTKYHLKKTHEDSKNVFEIAASEAVAGGEKADDELLGRCVVLAANFAHLDPEQISSVALQEQLLIADTTFQLFSRTILGAETLFSKKQRTIKKAEVLTQGLGDFFKEAILMKESYWQEALLENHPYGADILDYFEIWSMSKIPYSFEDFINLKPAHLRPSSSVRYLSEAEKKDMQVQFIEGKLYIQDAPLDTSKIPSEKEGGFAIYVLSCDFRMFVGPYLVGKFHHSSFANGGPVLGAGELQTTSDGTLVLISSKSGHYKPTAMQFHNTLQFLEEHDVDLSKVGLIENGLGGHFKKHPSVAEFRESTPSPVKSLRIRSNTSSPARFLLAGDEALSPSKAGGMGSPGFFIEETFTPGKAAAAAGGAGSDSPSADFMGGQKMTFTKSHLQTGAATAIPVKATASTIEKLTNP